MSKTCAEKAHSIYKAHKAKGGGMPTRGGFVGFLKKHNLVAFRRRVISGWKPNIVLYEFFDESKLYTIGRGQGHDVRLEIEGLSK